METKISVRHGHLDEVVLQQIREKVQKLLRFFDRLTMIECIVDLSNEINKSVELNVSAEHKHDFVSHEHHHELMSAVNLAVDKLAAQIHRYKEKIQNHHWQKPSTIDRPGELSPDEAGDE